MQQHISELSPLAGSGQHSQGSLAAPALFTKTAFSRDENAVLFSANTVWPVPMQTRGILLAQTCHAPK
jgi:hypothetical protein